MEHEHTDGAGHVGGLAPPVHRPMRERVEVLEEGAKDLNIRMRTFIRANPGATLLGAVAVGFFVGRLVRW